MARPPKPVIPTPVLTREQQLLAEAYAVFDVKKKALTDKYHADLAELKTTRKKCTNHVYGGKYIDFQWFNAWGREPGHWHVSGSAVCLICGYDGGWYCLPSPTGACEYDSKEDPIHDFCLHCGGPEERK